MAIVDLVKLYDAADSYNVRSQIVNVLGNRKEPEATDKLIDIVKNGTVHEYPHPGDQRAQRKNDPRATQLLFDILDGKKAEP